MRKEVKMGVSKNEETQQEQPKQQPKTLNDYTKEELAEIIGKQGKDIQEMGKTLNAVNIDRAGLLIQLLNYPKLEINEVKAIITNVFAALSIKVEGNE